MAEDLAAVTSAAFERWAQHEGILARITEEQCADLAKAFIAGYLTGSDVPGLPWME